MWRRAAAATGTPCSPIVWLAAVVVTLLDDPGAARPGPSLALLGVIARRLRRAGHPRDDLAATCAGRSPTRSSRGRPCSAIQWVDPGTQAWLLYFTLFPQLWAMVPTRWAAIGTVVVVVAFALVRWAQTDFASRATSSDPHLSGVISMGLSLALGLFINRIIGEAESRAETIDELRATQAQLAAAERDRGVHEERERISREIHDTLAQGFTSVVALSRAAQAALARGDVAAAGERLALIEHTASDNLDEARLIVAELTPGHLQSRTLGEALERLGRRGDQRDRPARRRAGVGRAGAAGRVGRGRHPAHRPGGAVQRAPPRVRRPGRPDPGLRPARRGGADRAATTGSASSPVTRAPASASTACRPARPRSGEPCEVRSEPGGGTTLRPGGAAVIRLLVVDDHPVVRAGMVAMLGEESDFEVVGEAANGAEALGLVPRLRPDVVLMDLRMPVMDGAEATARISAEPDAPQVLVLTTYDTDADIVRAVEAGARGYLLKDAPTGGARRRDPARGPRRDGAGPAGGGPAGRPAAGAGPARADRARGRGARPGRPRAVERRHRP